VRLQTGDNWIRRDISGRVCENGNEWIYQQKGKVSLYPTASLTYWSDFLAANPEVPSSILCANILSVKQWV
jgi:hypothetical protein